MKKEIFTAEELEELKKMDQRLEENRKATKKQIKRYKLKKSVLYSIYTSLIMIILLILVKNDFIIVYKNSYILTSKFYILVISIILYELSKKTIKAIF